MGFKMLSSRENNNLYFNFENAYFKVNNVRIEGSKVNFDLVTYPDKESRDAETENFQPAPHDQRQKRVNSKPFSVESSKLTIPTPSEGDTLDDVVKKAIYLYVKSLPDYSGAVDVL